MRRAAWLIGGAAVVVAAGVAGWVIVTGRGPPSRPAASTRPGAAPSSYAGSDSCRPCHAGQAEAWSGSQHARAERPLDPALDRRFFDPPRNVRHGSERSAVRADGDTLVLFTRGLDGLAPFRPDRVIGVEPLQQFLVPAPGGRWQATELAVDPRNGEWFDVFGDEDRRPGEWGHWTGRGMTWNAMCASCHNTAVAKKYDSQRDGYATSMAEPGVGCEACHGPSAAHVGAKREGRSEPYRAPGATAEQALATCGSCHSRRIELTGTFAPGEAYLDHFRPAIPDLSPGFYPDGQTRDENYEYASFLGSRLHAGGVTCGDCHDPHGGALRQDGNALCLSCHEGQAARGPRIEPSAHTGHPAASRGSRCVECHMPATTYMQRDSRRDHAFSIPDPDLTRELGIPNACGRCHANRSPEWAGAAIRRWLGAVRPRPARARARWVALAREGRREAIPLLLAAAREEPIPLWRAAAVGLLSPWSADDEVTPGLLASLGDSAALVRATAVRTLEPLVQGGRGDVGGAVRERLGDPSRLVRIEAAWAMRATIDPTSPAGGELLAYLAHNADQATGAYLEGVYHLDRGDAAGAEQRLRLAVACDPHSLPPRRALAIALSRLGRSADAVRELETACGQAPTDAECRFTLALGLSDVGRVNDAVAALEQAVALAPPFARAWYNLGLARAQVGRSEAALAALRRAEAADSLWADPPYARATVLARLGRLSEARAAAARALRLAPNAPHVAELVARLERPATPNP
jgi:predicted CXXCH cytochrome family protein